MFVDRLFKGLDTESYLTGEDPPTVPSPPPKVTAPPPSSRSSKGDSKNERTETSSPLQSANRRPPEDIRHREVSCRAGFSLEIYFHVVHNSIDRYETPSLHTAIEMLSGSQGYVGRV